VHTRALEDNLIRVLSEDTLSHLDESAIVMMEGNPLVCTTPSLLARGPIVRNPTNGTALDYENGTNGTNGTALEYEETSYTGETPLPTCPEVSVCLSCCFSASDWLIWCAYMHIVY
jgi:hypothetical protein